jgi:hypothetical protein
MQAGKKAAKSSPLWMASATHSSSSNNNNNKNTPNKASRQACRQMLASMTARDDHRRPARPSPRWHGGRTQQ